MATKRPPPSKPYYTPSSLAARTAWNPSSDPNAAYPRPITPTDEPESGPPAAPGPDDGGTPSSPQLPDQPQLASSPPPNQLTPPPDQPPLTGRTWDSVNQGLQNAQQQQSVQAAGQAIQPAAEQQPQERTWDSINQGIAGATQGAQGGQDQPQPTPTQVSTEQPPTEQPPTEQPPPTQPPAQPPAQLPEDEFKQKVAAATNVESKGGPPTTKLSASTDSGTGAEESAPTEDPKSYKNPNQTDFPSRIQAVDGNDPAAFIAHHTSGRGTVQGVIDTLKKRGLGVEYIMDRDGNIYDAGFGPGAANILPGWGEKGQGLSNKNVVGMEIIAKNDADVTPAQKESFAKFIAARYPNTPVLGHGEVNPGHKEADEGMSTSRAALALRAKLAGQTGQTDQPGTKVEPLQLNTREEYDWEGKSSQVGPSGNKLQTGPYVGLHPDDMKRLGVKQGDFVHTQMGWLQIQESASKPGTIEFHADKVGQFQDKYPNLTVDAVRAGGGEPPKQYSGAYIPEARVSGGVSTGGGQSGGQESTQEDKSRAVVPVPGAGAEEEKEQEQAQEEQPTAKPEEQQAALAGTEQKALPEGEGRVGQVRPQAPQDLEENITSPMLVPPGGMMGPQQQAIQESVTRPKKKKLPEEEEEGEEEGTASDAVAQALAQYQSATTQTAKNAALKTLKQVHLDSLAEGDTRVQHDPVTGKFKGTHFRGDDPVHQDALSSMPEAQKAKLAVAQNAIDNNELLHASFGSAKASPAVIPSKASREQEYEAMPSAQRQMEEAQIAGHSLMPVNIGVKHGQKKGEPNSGYIEGMSASTIAHNANHFNNALGSDSPYPDITSQKFADDFDGYVANLNHGWSGDGHSRLKGTEAVPIQATEGYEPHLLEAQEANFMNALMHNIAAKNKGGESKQRAYDLAAANGKEIGPDGEANPFRAMVDNRQSRRSWFPRQTEPPSRPWSEEMLESAFSTFPARLIQQLHDDPSQMAESIRPPEGAEAIARALQRRGVPHKDLVAANIVSGPIGKVEGRPPKPGGPGQMQLPLEGESQAKQIYWVNVDKLEQHLKKKGRKKA